MRRSTCAATVLSVAALLLALHLPVSAAAEGKVVYTKYNIHGQGKPDRKGNMVYEGSYANWVDPKEGHFVLPMNTQVTAEKGGGKFWEKGAFTLIIQDPSKLSPPIGKILVEFDAKRMGMNTEQYIDLITSPTPVRMDQFSPKDLEGIKAGKALVGMSKKGVMAALGYPAAHETPSLDGNTYTYWRDRFRRMVVSFNDKGIAVDVK